MGRLRCLDLKRNAHVTVSYGLIVEEHFLTWYGLIIYLSLHLVLYGIHKSLEEVCGAVNH